MLKLGVVRSAVVGTCWERREVKELPGLETGMEWNLEPEVPLLMTSASGAKF